MSHSEKCSRPHPHETLCGAATKAETAMAEGFLRDTGRLRPRRDGEREDSCVSNIPCHASAVLSCPRHPSPCWWVGAF